MGELRLFSKISLNLHLINTTFIINTTFTFLTPMKTSSLTYLALCSALLASCTGKKTAEEVPAGIVDPFDYTLTVTNIDAEDSTFVYLYDFDTMASSRTPSPESIVDSVMVADSTAVFTIKGTTAPVVAIKVNNRLGAILFPEAGDNSFDFKEKKGSGILNQKYIAYNDTIGAIHKMANEKAPAPKTPEYEAFNDSIDNLITTLNKITIEENIGNSFGYFLLSSAASDMSSAQLDSIIAKAPRLANAKRIQQAKEFIQKIEATSPGCQFTDFTITNDSGEVSLSQYVKPGQYTLVDFWASWCGPCKRAIAELKKNYDDLHAKGLNIVGVTVWEDPAETQKWLAENPLPWDIILDAQRVPTDLYGINGIPTLVLIGPDGTIIERSHSDEDILNAFNSAIENKANK